MSPWQAPRRETNGAQRAPGVGRLLAQPQVNGAPDELSVPPQDAKYFIPNPGANPRIEFWLDRPSVWTKKIRYLRVTGWCLATAGPEITEVRARVRGKSFPARFWTVRPDIALLFENRPGAFRSGFSLDLYVPPGRSLLTFDARCGAGQWEVCYRPRVRGSGVRGGVADRGAPAPGASRDRG